MADNKQANSASGGATFATDEISGVDYPRIKLVHGADGTNDGDISTANPLPVRLYVGTTTTNLGGGVEAGAIRVTVASDSTGVLSVDDNGSTISIDDGAGAITVDNGGTFAVQAAQSGTWTVTGTGGTFPVTDSGGSLTVDNAGTFAVQAACTNAGTFAVQVDGNALTALQLIDDCIYADDGAWTGDSSKHALVGGIYQASPQTITDGRTAPILLDANGKVQVASHAVTLTSTTITGTVAVTQSGTWDEVGINDSGNSITVDNAGTFAVQAVCTNAGTFAVQAACTNAGTFAVQVDGSALTALQLIDNIVHVDDAAFTLGTHSGVMMMGFAGTQSVDANDACALACDTDGALQISDGGNSLTVDNGGTFAVQAACTNAGTFAVQVDGAALTALQLIDNPVLVDDAAFTPATSSVMMAGFEADESSTDSVDEGDAGAARMTLDRKIIVTPQPHTAGGCSIFRTLDLDETEEDVKTSAGQIYGIFAINTTNAAIYLKFYNLTAANTTVGSSTPVMTLPVPGDNNTDGAGFYLPFPVGVAFDTAICAAATTGVADNDTGAPGANALIVHVFYK